MGRCESKDQQIEAIGVLPVNLNFRCMLNRDHEGRHEFVRRWE